MTMHILCVLYLSHATYIKMTMHILCVLYFNQNWIGLTVMNVRAVENTLQLHENVVQNNIAIGISSSAATLTVVKEVL